MKMKEGKDLLEGECWLCDDIFPDKVSLQTHLSEVHDVTFVNEGNLIDTINKILADDRRTLH